jgi:hypothetical protein
MMDRLEWALPGSRFLIPGGVLSFLSAGHSHIAGLLRFVADAPSRPRGRLVGGNVAGCLS